MAITKFHLTKTRLLGFSAVVLSALLPITLSQLPTNAIDLGDGRTFFDKPPRLINSVATFNSPSTPSEYLFTILLPEDAGEPLQAVSIVQKPNLERIRFELSKSRAFFGEGLKGGSSIPLAQVESEPNNPSEITIFFEEPVAPGNKVTVSIRARRNPSSGGVYIFGVTAFSVGENSPGLYLGSGRLHFTSRSDR
ncbi:MAG: DUF2808 domain-containing protein [Symploca sp. SIO1B1]|nr:DUF2808 domain-containing protein [Symploca sp. SIO1B1]